MGRIGQHLAPSTQVLSFSEVAVRNFLGVLAGILILSATAADAETIGRNGAACTRQSAIWKSLFDEPSAAPHSCAPRTNWFADPPVEMPLAPGPLLSQSASAAVTLFQQAASTDQTPAATPRPKAFEYSHAYTTRRKIHFIASFATIPLFVTEAILGGNLYEGTSGGSTKSVHSAAAVGIEVLVGINTVTGVWNMWESRKDPNAGKKRFIHGFLMLASGVGFVATGLLAPGDDGGDRSTHRNVAITSMAVATASYFMMLIGR
jgi:hypothetical protein